MLSKVSDQIAHCYHRAHECRAMADDTCNEAAKQDFLDLERRWLLLARSYELGDRFADFANEFERRLHVLIPPEPQHRALPRIRCPECGKQMRLEMIEPCPDEAPVTPIG
jgi:hypothetical protein